MPSVSSSYATIPVAPEVAPSSLSPTTAVPECAEYVISVNILTSNKKSCTSSLACVETFVLFSI